MTTNGAAVACISQVQCCCHVHMSKTKMKISEMGRQSNGLMKVVKERMNHAVKHTKLRDREPRNV
jgi:hypothetical protein